MPFKNGEHGLTPFRRKPSGKKYGGFSSNAKSGGKREEKQKSTHTTTLLSNNLDKNMEENEWIFVQK